MSEGNGSWTVTEDGSATRVLGFIPDLDASIGEPTRYRIEFFDELGIDPAHTFHSYGGWNIEGDFLMVYEGDTKTGYRIPPTTTMIKTTEEPAKPLTSNVEFDNHFQDEAAAALLDEPTPLEVRKETPNGDE